MPMFCCLCGVHAAVPQTTPSHPTLPPAQAPPHAPSGHLVPPTPSLPNSLCAQFLHLQGFTCSGQSDPQKTKPEPWGVSTPRPSATPSPAAWPPVPCSQPLGSSLIRGREWQWCLTANRRRKFWARASCCRHPGSLTPDPSLLGHRMPTPRACASHPSSTLMTTPASLCPARQASMLL